MGSSEILISMQVGWGFWAHSIYLACERKCLPRRCNAAWGLVQLRPTAAHRDKKHEQLFAAYINLSVQLCCTRKLKKPVLLVPCLGWGLHPGRYFDYSPEVWGEHQLRHPAGARCRVGSPAQRGILGSLQPLPRQNPLSRDGCVQVDTTLPAPPGEFVQPPFTLQR